MNWLVREFRAWREALRFFTRFPLPSARHWDPIDLERASTYFPCIGWIVGGVAALSWWLAAKIWPPSIASGISLVATLLFTGAFHEDGLADVCDGFGGGTNRERILEIMVDSRVGAYGAIGVAMALLLKWQAVAALPSLMTPWSLWSAHALSRGGAVAVQIILGYVGKNDGKAKPLSATRSWIRRSVALIFAIVPLAFAPAPGRMAWTLLSVFGLQGILAWWFKRRIGGYTGDCLGATQQLCEIAFYLTVLALVR